jgi:cytochrome P450
VPADIRPGRFVVDRYPILSYLPDVLAPWRREARHVFAELDEFWSVFFDSIDRRVKAGTAPACFLSSLLQDPEVVNLSRTERVATTATTLSAGSETTATSLQWVSRPRWMSSTLGDSSADM